MNYRPNRVYLIINTVSLVFTGLLHTLLSLSSIFFFFPPFPYLYPTLFFFFLYPTVLLLIVYYFLFSSLSYLLLLSFSLYSLFFSFIPLFNSVHHHFSPLSYRAHFCSFRSFFPFSIFPSFRPSILISFFLYFILLISFFFFHLPFFSPFHSYLLFYTLFFLFPFSFSIFPSFRLSILISFFIIYSSISRLLYRPLISRLSFFLRVLIVYNFLIIIH